MTVSAPESPDPMDVTATDAPRREGSIFSARQTQRLNPLYGRFVGFMKVLLPFVATVLLVLVAIWPQLSEQNRRFSIGPARIDKDAAKNLTMVNARYTGVDDLGRPFTVTATNALQEEPSTQIVDLEQPKADIVLEDGSWVALTATDGVYNREKQTLELTGTVNLFHDKGYEFNTTSAIFDLAAGDAIGTDPVQGQGPFGNLQSEGFIIRNRGESVEFTGDARLVIHPDKVDGAGVAGGR